jgi:hypothetical protein
MAWQHLQCGDVVEYISSVQYVEPFTDFCRRDPQTVVVANPKLLSREGVLLEAKKSAAVSGEV